MISNLEERQRSGWSFVRPGSGRPFEHSDVIFAIVGLLWLVLIITSFVFSWRQAEQTSFALAAAEAQASYSKDLSYRRWVTMHGGVYVPPDETTPPNPYLRNVPKRDIITVDGDRLTLVNPAYMTRQVHGLAKESYGAQGHITSLKPIRPENGPDAWEQKALLAFASGVKEVRAREVVDGVDVFRLMRPMITEAGCLRCHAEQGYRVGDVRGGISVTVPFAPYLAIEQQQKQGLALSHALIGLVGLLVLWLSQRFLARSNQLLQESEQRLERLVDSLGEGVILQDASENIVLWNRTAAAIFELGSDEIVGSPAAERDWQTIHDDGTPFPVQEHPSLHTLRTGESRSGVIMGIRKEDGEATWIKINTRPLFANETTTPQAVIISFSDITEIRRTKQQLQQSEEKFRLLFENLTAGFALHQMVYDENNIPTDYRYLEVNPAFERLTGLQAPDIIGRTVKEVIPSIEQHWIDIYGKVALTGESVSYQNYARELDRYYDVWAFSPARHQFAVVFSDITERIRAERVLSDNEKNLSSLFHAIDEGVCLVDRDGTLITVNKTFAERYDKRVNDCIGESIYSLAGQLELVIAELLRTGRPIQYEDVHRGRYYHYSLFPVLDVHGSVNRIALFSMDITKRQQAEENYRYLSENVQDVVYSVTLDGIILDVGSSIKELSGGQYDREELIGRPMTAVYADPVERDGFLAALHRGGRVSDYRLTLKNRDGSRRICSVSAKICFDNNGKPVKILGNIRDISDRVALEKQLLQAQKMESVGRLAGGVAHDFNNMLGVILGYTDIALDGVEKNQPVYGALQEIKQAAQRSVDLTGQLLAFARKQTAIPKVFELNDMVSGMLTMLGRLIGEGITLQWRPAQSSTSVKMDPSQLDQILANLCVNARDAIKGTGTITIETGTELIETEDSARTPAIAPGRYVTLDVSDTGEGIGAESLTYLFEPFFTTKQVGKGTGLGLATVYGIVQQNNGYIDVRSEVGHGSAFRVYLPRHEGDTVLPHSPGEPETAVDQGSGTVLLVEDEPMILNLTTRMLQKLGYHVLPAASPDEALRIAEQHSLDIKLLITDVIMPGMNGRDLAAKVRGFYPQLECLFMSGYTADVIAHHGVLDAGVRFIQKPFTRNDLARKVSEALGEGFL